MKNSECRCNECDEEITEYYHEGYKGKRGKCLHCGQEFPLE